MRSPSALLLCLILLSSTVRSEEVALPHVAPPVSADSTNRDVGQPRRPFGGQLIYDTGYVLTAPARWDADDWKWFGIAAAAIVGTGILFDKRESDVAADRSNSLNELASKAEPFGAGYSALVLGSFYAGGKLFDSPRAVAVGVDGLTASIIASGILSPLIKWSVGRVRPADTESPSEFHPFGHNHSFPSGHATEAFTLASVINAHYDSPWIDATTYATAGLVGYARHEHQAHWASDILAGAMLGISVGKTVVTLNDENRGIQVSLVESDQGPIASLVVPLR